MERWIGDFPTRCRYNEYLAETFGYLCFCFDCVNRGRRERGLPPMSRGPLRYMSTPIRDQGMYEWTGGYAELESPFPRSRAIAAEAAFRRKIGLDG